MRRLMLQVALGIALPMALWPLKLIYRQPVPSWTAWFANRKLCQLDQRYC